MRYHAPASLLAAALSCGVCVPAGAAPASAENPLVTGRSSADSAAYWSCSVRGASSSAEDLHLRFWADGTGFSGQSATTWRITGENSLEIEHEGGAFGLRDIAFSALEQESDVLSATDSTGAALWCQRFGPAGVDGTPAAFDDSASDVLQMQLLNLTGTSWRCDERDVEGSLFSADYTFLPGARATLDGRSGHWFVDDQFNVVLSLENGEALTIGDVRFDAASPGLFRARRADRTLECGLV